jgi:uncharacterized protein (DUF1778 family)
MARTTSTIKNITTSFRITTDMDRYIKEAANKVGASKGELYRLGAYETAKEIMTNPQVANELSVRFAI